MSHFSGLVVLTVSAKLVILEDCPPTLCTSSKQNLEDRLCHEMLKKNQVLRFVFSVKQRKLE